MFGLVAFCLGVFHGIRDAYGRQVLDPSLLVAQKIANLASVMSIRVKHDVDAFPSAENESRCFLPFNNTQLQGLPLEISRLGLHMSCPVIS